jgi:hypothetical protein
MHSMRKAPRADRAARRSVLWCALLLSIVVGACASDNHPVIMIDNQLAIPLTVVFLDETGTESSVLETLPANAEYPVSIFPTDRCTPGVLVARDKSTGAEVARSIGPVCRPSRWVISAPGASETSAAASRRHGSSRAPGGLAG